MHEWNNILFRNSKHRQTMKIKSVVGRIKKRRLNYCSSFMLIYAALDFVWLLAWCVVLVFFNPRREFYSFSEPGMDLMCAIILQLLLSIGPSILYPRVRNKWWLQIFPFILLVFLIIGMVSPAPIWRTCFALVGMSVINTVHVVYDYTYWMTDNRAIRTYIFCFLVVVFYALVTYWATKIADSKDEGPRNNNRLLDENTEKQCTP